MNKERLISAGLFVAALMAGLFTAGVLVYLLTAPPAFPKKENEISRALDDVAHGAHNSFALQDVTPFVWKNVAIIGPYMAQHEVNRLLGFDWSDYGSFNIAEADDADLIVFYNDKTIVHVVRHSRSKGDFEESALNKVLTPMTAVFKIQRADDWVKFKLVKALR
ncbi:MAG: hypothetical protein V4691_01785 [Pseudomonadota bacterium]